MRHNMFDDDMFRMSGSERRLHRWIPRFVLAMFIVVPIVIIAVWLFAGWAIFHIATNPDGVAREAGELVSKFAEGFRDTAP